MKNDRPSHLNFELSSPLFYGFQGNLAPTTNYDHNIVQLVRELTTLLKFRDDVAVNRRHSSTTGRRNEHAMVVCQLHTC